MTYLILSDIHANLEALDAVLATAAPYDHALVLGDLVGEDLVVDLVDLDDLLDRPPDVVGEEALDALRGHVTRPSQKILAR